MKVIFQTLVLILAAVLTSCTDEAPTRNDIENQSLICGFKDPINELKWLNDQLKDFIGGAEINGIILYKYENRQVIEVQSSVFNSTNQHQYYCNGDKLNLDDSGKFAAFKKDRELVKVLYGTNIWN